MKDELYIKMAFDEFEARMKKMKEAYKEKCLKDTRDFLQLISFYEDFDEKEHVKKAFEILEKAGEES